MFFEIYVRIKCYPGSRHSEHDFVVGSPNLGAIDTSLEDILQSLHFDPIIVEAGIQVASVIAACRLPHQVQLEGTKERSNISFEARLLL